MASFPVLRGTSRQAADGYRLRNQRAGWASLARPDYQIFTLWGRARESIGALRRASGAWASFAWDELFYVSSFGAVSRDRGAIGLKKTLNRVLSLSLYGARQDDSHASQTIHIEGLELDIVLSEDHAAAGM